MATDDEFYLGEASENTEFFLGDSTEEFYLGNESANNQEEVKQNASVDDKAYQELLDTYEILKIDLKPYKVEFEEYFKDNPEIFKVAGTKYFKTLSEKEFKSFELKCDKLVAIAHKKWIKIENQRKLEELENALNTLKSIFRQPAKTEAYIEEIKRTLKAHLNAALKQKLKDGILEVSEIQELMEIAVSIRLIPDSEKGRLSILNSIKSANERNIFKIESFEETFIRIVSEKEKFERMNTDTVRNNLFKEYKELNSINNYVLANKKTQTDTQLFEDMCQLLTDNNLLISNTELFMLEFLEPEIQKKGDFYFSVPLNNDYFYYLKGTATNKYELTEDQWRQLTMIRNIRNESDFTVAYIMGYKKESSVIGIAKLLRENPETAYTRILAGDLETYFSHIGRQNIAKKISTLKEAYKSNSEELVTGVVNLLSSEVGDSIESTEIKQPEKETLDSLIKQEKDIKDLVSFVIQNKNDEILINELTKDSIIVERLQTLLFSKTKKYTFIKFLLNVLCELLLESDISQYKYAFIKIATKVQQLLIEKNEYITFNFVYAVLVEKAINENVITSNNEIPDFTDNYNKMKELSSENENQEKSSEKKSIFGIFKKGE